MRLALFGLPKRATQFIPKLIAERYNVVAIFLSEPYEPYFPQIEALAEAYKIPCVYPAQPDDPTLASRLVQIGVDLLISVNFTKRLPKNVLTAPRRGAVNLHPSLLPRYRGPNPYYWVIRNGEEETGVTAHYMEESFDTGPILLQKSISLAPAETLGSLLARLEALMEDVLLDLLRLFREHEKVEGSPQDPALAGFAPQVKDADLRIDFSGKTVEIMRQIRACNPAYGAWSVVEGRVIKIFSAATGETALSFEKPGTLIHVDGVPLIVTGDGSIKPEVVLVDEGGFYTSEQLIRLGILSPGSRFE